MDLSQKFKSHVGKREAVAKVTRELEYTRRPCGIVAAVGASQ